MAGHSKFANIKHRKGAQDKKRAKIFNRLGKEITVATKLAGPDPDSNPRLRLAISAAKSGNMPNDRIAKAIASGDPNAADAKDYEEIRYEGYGHGGVAVIVETMTDNRNRTVAEMRMIFSKANANLGESNSVLFGFDRAGEIVLPITVGDFDSVFEAALELGAEDIEEDGDFYTIYCPMESFAEVQKALEEKYETIERSGLIWKPKTMIEVDLETAEKNMRLVDALEDSDDVQAVFTNMDMSDDIAETLMAADA
jgi:YebC/PmpR family DNA-binding regulatory protein